MIDMMTFPETWEEFEKSYGFDDSEEVYTNGSRLIPSFRVKQWLDHIAQFKSKRQATVSSDCISRQDAIRLAEQGQIQGFEWQFKKLCTLPSTQLERDIPVKPIETTDKAWGIPLRQAVCPKCDYYLGHIAFLDCYKGKRITYCETCGQAIDWDGWDFDD